MKGQELASNMSHTHVALVPKMTRIHGNAIWIHAAIHAAVLRTGRLFRQRIAVERGVMTGTEWYVVKMV
jgi:hypothetical protein